MSGGHFAMSTPSYSQSFVMLTPLLPRDGHQLTFGSAYQDNGMEEDVYDSKLNGLYVYSSLPACLVESSSRSETPWMNGAVVG